MKSICPRNLRLALAGQIVGSLALLLPMPVHSETNANPQLMAPQNIAPAIAFPSTNWPVPLSPGIGGEVIVRSSAAQTTVMPQLILRNGGALFQSAAFSAAIADDISAPNAVDLQMVNGQHIKAAIYGLAYIDFASGKRVLLAQLRPSTGQMLSPNRLLFQNCFDSGIAADVEFDIFPNSIEQLVVLRKNIPGPDTFELPETSRLAVITAFEAPVPAQIPNLIDLAQQNQVLGVQGEEAMQDATLLFGSMRVLYIRA